MIRVTQTLSGDFSISYPRSDGILQITKAEYNLVKGMSDRKVMAIKFIKDQYNLGLYEAKQVVDTIHAT